MNIGSFFKKLFGSTPVKSVEAFALTETQKVVAALSTSTIGKTVAANIAELMGSADSGAVKFEKVVANTLPLLAQLLTQGGRVTAIKEVEDIGRALVQQVFNDTMSTKAGTIASQILALLGIK